MHVTPEQYQALLEVHSKAVQDFNQVWFTLSQADQDRLHPLLIQLLRAASNVARASQELHPEAFIGQGIGET